MYAASSSTYGDSPELPKVEDKIGSPLPYAVTKYVDELYADVFNRCYGFSSVGLRYFNVFGQRQDPTPADSYEPIFGIWNRENEICGLIGFHFSDFANHRTEIGYWLLPEYQHQGIMTDCVRRLCRWAVETKNIKRIQIRCTFCGSNKQRHSHRAGSFSIPSILNYFHRNVKISAGCSNLRSDVSFSTHGAPPQCEDALDAGALGALHIVLAVADMNSVLGFTTEPARTSSRAIAQTSDAQDVVQSKLPVPAADQRKEWV